MDAGLKADGSVTTMMGNDAFDAAGKLLSCDTDAVFGDHVRSDYTTA